MPRPLSTAQFAQPGTFEKIELSDGITDEEIQMGLKRLAKVRNNLREVRLEISEKILDGIAECKSAVNSTTAAIGELNAVLTGPIE